VAKKVKAIVKVQIQAGKATAAPPVGTALGPHGINMGQFIKEYNERTAPLTGTVVPAVVTIFEDRSYTFVTKSPPAADLIRKELGLEKGSPTPNKNKVGTLSKAKVRRSPRRRWPTSTRTPSSRPCGWSRAPPVAWASRSRASEDRPTTA